MAKILSGVKQCAEKAVDDRRRKQAKKRLERLEKKLQEEKLAQEKIEEEKRAIQKEKERLMQMDQHELLAEAIMAVRGFYKEFEDLKIRQKMIEGQITVLAAEIAAMGSDDDDDDDYE